MSPTPQDLLEAAIAMRPVLLERASATREQRQVLTQTMDDLKAAGFFKMIQPARHGGFEMNPKHFYNVVFEIARACPSSGWVLSVVGVHGWQLGLLDARAQDDVWSSDDSVLISSSYAPKGQVQRENDGYRISGRWQFSSGSDHCDWIFVGGMIPPEKEGDAPGISSFLIPRQDYRIEDDWYTTGLQGSGSKSLVVENAFVPAYRVHSFAEGFDGSSPGIAVNTHPIFKLPFGQAFVRAVSMPAVGAAQGALDAYCEYNTTRLNSVGMQAKEFPASQAAGAAAQSVISSARLKMHHAYDTLLGHVERGEAFPDIERAEFRYDACQAVDECVKAVQQLLANSGGGAIYTGNRINEVFQDMLAFRQHAANQPDNAAKNVGAVLFGQPNGDAFS